MISMLFDVYTAGKKLKQSYIFPLRARAFLTLTSNRITKTLFLHRPTAHLSFAHTQTDTQKLFLLLSAV